MPWMIGRAFEKISDPKFLALLGSEPNVPTSVKLFLTNPLVSNDADKRNLSVSLQNAAPEPIPSLRPDREDVGLADEVGRDVRRRCRDDRVRRRRHRPLAARSTRYQLLVPSYLVMFAFFLVLTVGWLIVAERRQGTLKRLSLAPVSRLEVLLGKLVPCLVLSLFQGSFLLIAGKLLFGMSWGPEPAYLFVVVAATSLAAMGLAMLVASVARTETQVAIYGTLLVLVLAGLSGCLMGDRSMMPEQMQELSRVTPHAWALDAYRQLLTNPTPNLTIVWQACAVLVGFAVVFLGLAWASMRWE